MCGRKDPLERKKERANMYDSADLSCPEANMPEQITQRILWRVAQTQYGPIGLLSVYIHDKVEANDETSFTERETDELGKYLRCRI
jgi:hypothetical protein